MADIIITPASSLMAFTSSLNYKQTLTQEASGSLTLLGSGSTGRTDIFTVNGNNGTLFSVSDDLSNSLFSVNTIAGLPVIEAFANNTVVMGQYGQNVLVITGSRVGIGTATPSTTLHVSARDSSRVLFGPNATWGAYLYVGASPNITSNTVAQVISTNGNLHLDSGTSQNTYINGYSQTSTFINPEGGSVSIGTYDAPGARLQVNTTSDVVAIFKRTSNGASGIQFTNAGSNYSTLYGGYDSFALRYFYNTSEYLTMTTSGNLGIGINSPGYKLDVNGDIGVSGAIIDTSGNLLYWNPGEYYFYAGGRDAINDIQYNPRQGITSISDRAEMASTWGGESYYNGQVLSKVTANETISRGKLVYLRAANGKWALADAITVSSSKPLLGIALDNVSADESFSVLLDGMIITPYHGQNNTATPGAPLYVATSNVDAPGYVTQDAPSATGEVLRLVGHNIYDTGNGVIIRFQPDNTWTVL